MAVDRTQGVLEGTAMGAAPKAARQRQPRERGPSTRGIEVAQKTLDLFNQGHSIPDIGRLEVCRIAVLLPKCGPFSLRLHGTYLLIMLPPHSNHFGQEMHMLF